MAKALEGFRDFILRGNVVDLAVGVIIGASFKTIVDAFVEGVVNPGLALLVGEQNFDDLLLGPIHYGVVITALVNFLLTAAVLYFFLVLPMTRFMQRREELAAQKAAAEAAEVAAAPPEPSAEEKLLIEIRDALLAQK